MSPRDYLESSLKEQRTYLWCKTIVVCRGASMYGNVDVMLALVRLHACVCVGGRNRIRQKLTSFFKDRDCVTLVRPIIDEAKLQVMVHVLVVLEPCS